MTLARSAKREGAAAARAAISSIVATLIDGIAYQIVLAAAVHGVKAIYPAAAVVGAVAGAVTNFLLNRHWAFRADREPLLGQGARYAAGSIVTLLVLEALLWIFVDRMGVDARVAWLPAKVLTWAAFSYPFQRIVVFSGAER
jgi:putative flippase GtrA